MLFYRSIYVSSTEGNMPMFYNLEEELLRAHQVSTKDSMLI